MNEKNLQKLNRLFQAMDEDSLTRKEFTDNFAKVLKFLKNLKEKNQAEFTSFRGIVSDLADKLKGSNEENLSGLKDKLINDLSKLETKFSSTIDKALREQEVGMNFIRDKVRSIENGKDADEEKIVQDVLGQLPEYKETILDTPEQIADKLETLKGKARLKISAIMGLDEKINELGQRRVGGMAGGGVGKLALEAKFVDWTLLDTGDGTTTDFVLPKKPNPPVSLELKVGGANLFLTDDYTYTESTRTISFTIAPPLNEKIRYKCRL